MLAVSFGADFAVGTTQKRIILPDIDAYRAVSRRSLGVARRTIVARREVKFLRLPGEDALLTMRREFRPISRGPKSLDGQQSGRLVVAVAVPRIPQPFRNDNRRLPGAYEADHFFQRRFMPPDSECFLGALRESELEYGGEVGFNSVDPARFEKLSGTDESHGFVFLVAQDILPAVSASERKEGGSGVHLASQPR